MLMQSVAEDVFLCYAVNTVEPPECTD